MKNNVDQIVSQVIAKSQWDQKAIHNHMRKLKGSKWLRQINKYINRKCKRIKRDIKDKKGEGKGKYTKLGLYTFLSDKYDHLQSYLKRKITKSK